MDDSKGEDLFANKSTRGAFFVSIERSGSGRERGWPGGVISVPFTLTKTRCRERKDENVCVIWGCIDDLYLGYRLSRLCERGARGSVCAGVEAQNRFLTRHSLTVSLARRGQTTAWT